MILELENLKDSLSEMAYSIQVKVKSFKSLDPPGLVIDHQLYYSGQISFNIIDCLKSS